MPRVVMEELVGYQFGVGQGELPVTDERGNVIHDGKGAMKMQPVWQLQFEQLTPLGMHRVVISFTEEGKAELIRQLTGGVILASANGHVA